jgi:hypothetical protein
MAITIAAAAGTPGCRGILSDSGFSWGPQMSIGNETGNRAHFLGGIEARGRRPTRRHPAAAAVFSSSLRGRWRPGRLRRRRLLVRAARPRAGQAASRARAGRRGGSIARRQRTEGSGASSDETSAFGRTRDPDAKQVGPADDPDRARRAATPGLARQPARAPDHVTVAGCGPAGSSDVVGPTT